MGNRTNLGYPDGKTVDYTYDASHRLIEVMDWEGQVTSYGYDPGNRLETVALPNGVVSTYSYNEAGQLTNLTHAAESVTLSSFEYIYDTVGNRVQVVEILRQPGSLPEYRLFLPLVLNGMQGDDSGFSPGEATPTAAAATEATPSPTSNISPRSEPTETPSPTLAPTGTWTLSPMPTGTGTPVATPTATATPATSATESATLASEGTPTIEPTGTLAESAGAIRLPGLAALVPVRGQADAETSGDVITHTIDYSYDPLYRLTGADYDDGTFYHYTYDAVGNRQTQDTLAGTDTYVYDEANKLIEVNGVALSWDDNGNLRSDGVSDYSYNHANRLTSVVQGPETYTFEYNGLGDRLQQTVNGDTVDYTLDLNAGLTQVLYDGMNAYLYGAGRIGEQQPDGWQYHHGDALGSVRQLTDPTGAVTVARSYEPFGSTLASTGLASTVFQFTSEQRDGTGLVYLRSRYYSPEQGRFLSQDTWGGILEHPLSQNRWLYVDSDPVNAIDPSGLYPVGDSARTGDSDFCRCLITLYEQDLFFGTADPLIYHSSWLQFPISLPIPLPLPAGVDVIDTESWSRGISQDQNGEVWHVRVCFGFLDHTPTLFPEKQYLVEPAVTVNLALWEQDLLVASVYSFNLLKYKHYGAYLITAVWGRGTLPADAGDNGEWPYSDLEILFPR